MPRFILGLFATFLLPLLYLGILNPVLFRWHYKHGNTPPPPDLARRAERVDNLIPFVALATVFVAVLGLLRWAGQNLGSLGLIYAGIQPAAAYGIAAGLIWLSLYAGVIFLFRPTAQDFSQHLPARWGLPLWLPLSLSSAIVEEVWRAYCLISMAEFGNVIAISLMAAAYGLAHLLPLGRALSATLFGIFAAYLFLNSGLLWVPIFAHAVMNIGVFFLIRSRV